MHRRSHRRAAGVARRVPVALLLLSTLATTVPVPALAAGRSAPPLAAGRYIVVLADDAVASDPTDRDRAPRVSGVKVDRHVSRLTTGLGVRPSHVYRAALGGFAATLSSAQATALRADPAVKRLLPDEKGRLETSPDSDGSLDGGVVTTVLTTAVLPTGIDRSEGDRSPIARIDGVDERMDSDIAILDTGIQKSHPDLNVAGGYNCTSSDRSAYGDVHGHGTHVAGTAAALDDAKGVVGMAPGARLWGIKVFNDSGETWNSWILCGVDWVTARRDASDATRPLIEVANMSLSGPMSIADDHSCGRISGDVYHQTLCRSIAGGTVYVVAAGNQGTWASSRRPAGYDDPITVSALADFDGKAGGTGIQANICPWYSGDVDDTYADFSNYGVDVDIMAPGKCILSTFPGTRWAWQSGTSMASPTVAGAAALYRLQFPYATPLQVKRGLRAVATLDWATSTDPDGKPDLLLKAHAFRAPPDYSLAVTTPPAALAPERQASISVAVRRTSDHTDAVTLSVDGLPSGVTAAAASTTTSTAVLTLTATADVAAGTYPVTVRGDDGDLRRSATPVNLVVEGARDDQTPTVDFAVPDEGTVTFVRAGVARVEWTETDAGGSGLVPGTLRHEQAPVAKPGSCEGVTWVEDGVPADVASPFDAPYLAPDTCHRWVRDVSDGAGNFTSHGSGTILVDTLAPDAPTVTSATGAMAFDAATSTLFFKGDADGVGRLEIAARDAGSGVTSVESTLPATDGLWTASTESADGWTGMTLTWSAGASSGTLRLTATDAAGNVGPTAEIGTVSDASAPSPVAWALPSTTASSSGEQALVWDGGADTGSGLATAHLVQRQRGVPGSSGCESVTYTNDGDPALRQSGAVDTDLAGGTCYRWVVTTLDRVGNAAAPVTSRGMTYDVAPATLDFTDPDEGTVTLRASSSLALTFTTQGGAVREVRHQLERGAVVTGGTCTGVVYAPDATTTGGSPLAVDGLLSGSCYRWRSTVVDRAGNTTEALSGEVLVDLTAPAAPTLTATGPGTAASGSIVYFRDDGSGSVEVVISASDAESGVQDRSLAPVTATGWTSGAPGADRQTLTWTAGATNAVLSATARNGAGSTSAATYLAFVADHTAPTLELLSPAAGSVRPGTSVVVQWREQDAGSGIAPATRLLVRERAKVVTPGSCAGVTWAVEGRRARPANPTTATGFLAGYCYRWTVSVADRVGNAVAATTPTVLVDGTLPVVTVPVARLVTSQTMPTTGLVPVRVTWTGSDESGPVRYELRSSTDAGATWTDVTLTDAASPTTIAFVAPSTDVVFAVRATDPAGNASAWLSGAAARARVVQSSSTSVSTTGTWTKLTNTNASGGATRYATAAGATFKYSFTGRSVAWLSRMSPTRGAARVYVDGTYVRTVDLKAATTEWRHVVFSRTWSTSGAHTLLIKVVGTSGRPAVDVDAVMVMAP